MYAHQSLFTRDICLLQDVRNGTAVTKKFHGLMQELVNGMRKERPADSSIAAHLLDIKHPKTGTLFHDPSHCLTQKACWVSNVCIS